MTDTNLHWKGHVVSDELVHDIEMDLYDRSVAKGESCMFLIVNQTDEAYFDLPGVILETRSHRDLDLNGLKITIPSQDFADILYELKLLKPRELSNGVKFYKLHGWRYVIVLSVGERQALIEAMEAQAEAAEAEAEVDRRRFIDGMKKANVVSPRATQIEKALKGNEGAN